MNKKDEVNEWIEFAKRDFDTAVFLKTMYPAPFEIICYHCEQAVEKLLKGFLILNDDEFDKTHDLLHLNKKCISHDKGFDIITKECADLTIYGVNVRYPGNIHLKVEDAEKAINDAAKIKEFILNKINITFKDFANNK
jgi:HEPN domain-containing protein